ncbi:uncharacterized protein CIMG_13780 [Coccidioides immitis RS]|uniref:Uncharacterized protein n=1 Tax=Coccidioides immitis (strain RS) TaxID=246410 RepID=A0A0E1S374_COCIM|nr:uncharacterized protein CIMG_13780 [Coccidioides immitis RS]EAS33200.2 hypothetical protein CIMG_13780 [Coccidioides immitis RS]
MSHIFNIPGQHLSGRLLLAASSKKKLAPGITATEHLAENLRPSQPSTPDTILSISRNRQDSFNPGYDEACSLVRPGSGMLLRGRAPMGGAVARGWRIDRTRRRVRVLANRRHRHPSESFHAG